MANLILAEAISKFCIFEGLLPEEIQEIASLVKEKNYHSSQNLFKQGDRPDYFYLVKRGIVQVVGRDGAGQVNLRRRAEKGDFVGHRSIMENTPRRATALVAADSELLAISAADFKAVIAAFPKLHERLRRTDTVNRLLATPLFSCFSLEQLFHIADLAKVVEYPAGEAIFYQGEPAAAFYVIDRGQVKESVSGAAASGHIWPKYLTAGSFFGRHDLLRNSPRRATAEAVTETRLFRFNADAFHWLGQLQPAFNQALARPDVLRYLQGVPLFSQLGSQERQCLAGFVGLAHFPEGEVLYRQGEVDSTLYILYEGEAVVRIRDEQGKSRPVGYLKPGNAVGEHSLFLQEPRDATVEPVVGSNWFYLTREDLDLFLSQHPQTRDKLIPKEEVTARQRLKRFPWMEADEQFVFRERRHWFFLLNRLIPPLIALLLLLPLLVFDLPLPLTLFVAAITGIWVLWRFVDWANDYYIITTKQVAHREKVLGISERRDATPLDKIQNVNIESGLWGNIFGFGALIIDTAAATVVTRVTFDYVGEPQHVQALIFEQVRRRQAGERSETHRAIRDRLEENIGLSIRPVIPRPAIPRPEMAPASSSGSGLWDRIAEATWRRWFWIQKREGDQVTWRKHWIRLLRKIWPPAVVLLFLLLVLGLLLALPEKPLGVIALLAVFALPILGWLWWSWEDWGNDLYAVTDDRIIDTEALPLGFRSRRTETTFDRIQNVSSDIPNPLATLLNYGTVVIYTAGAEGRLDFEYVRDPKGVQAEIFRRLIAYQAQQGRQQREQRWEEMPQWFATYEEMRRP